MLIFGIILIVYALLVLIIPDLWWMLYAAARKKHLKDVERTQDLERQRKTGSLSALVVGILGVLMHLSWT